MRGLRIILDDSSSRSAMLSLAVLLLLLQTVVAGAMGVARVAEATGDHGMFVLCSPLSEGGSVEIDDADTSVDIPCPLCRVTGIASLAVAIDDVDLGAAYVLKLNDAWAALADDRFAPEPLASKLSPDRTGPPVARSEGI